MIPTHASGNPTRRPPAVVLDARTIAGKTAAPVRRVRVLGAVAPQHRLLRGPTTPPRADSSPASAKSTIIERRFVSNMEVLDALLAGAHERLLARLSRLGMRRGQAQRFVVAATGRLLRAARPLGDLADGKRAGEVAAAVAIDELSARTRVSRAQAERGLQVVLSELTAVLSSTGH